MGVMHHGNAHCIAGILNVRSDSEGLFSLVTELCGTPDIDADALI